ncbi:hypothetical protein KC711_07375 [Candidatus Peregrinibacteria bacterium]|nr:hypothetical protein [Candidatus Peregrinibacteria bacterium]
MLIIFGDSTIHDFCISIFSFEYCEYATHAAITKTSKIIHGITFLHEKQEFVLQDPVAQDLFGICFSIKKKKW